MKLLAGLKTHTSLPVEVLEKKGLTTTLSEVIIIFMKVTRKWRGMRLRAKQCFNKNIPPERESPRIAPPSLERSPYTLD